MSIAAILQRKGSDVIQVKPTDSLLSVVKLLAEQRIGCVFENAPLAHPHRLAPSPDHPDLAP